MLEFELLLPLLTEQSASQAAFHLTPFHSLRCKYLLNFDYAPGTFWTKMTNTPSKLLQVTPKRRTWKWLDLAICQRNVSPCLGVCCGFQLPVRRKGTAFGLALVSMGAKIQLVPIYNSPRKLRAALGEKSDRKLLCVN